MFIYSQLSADLSLLNVGVMTLEFFLVTAILLSWRQHTSGLVSEVLFDHFSYVHNIFLHKVTKDWFNIQQFSVMLVLKPIYDVNAIIWIQLVVSTMLSIMRVLFRSRPKIERFFT